MKKSMFVYVSMLVLSIILNGSIAGVVRGETITWGPSGGSGGGSFKFVSGADIQTLKIRAGRHVDGIEVIYRDGKRGQAGGRGGGEHIWNFAQGEYIQGIEGIYGGDLVDELCIRTNRRYNCFGGKGGNVNFRYHAPPGYKINGFWGRAGQYLDAIGVLLIGSSSDNYQPVDAGPSGGSGGGNFSFIRYTRINEIEFRAGQHVDAIGASYVATSSPTGILRNWAGGRGGGTHSLILAPNEYITEISGEYGGSLVDRICIRTNRGRRQCGGGSGGNTGFIYQAPPGYAIQGFYGRAGQYLDAIGATFYPLSSINE